MYGPGKRTLYRGAIPAVEKRDIPRKRMKYPCWYLRRSGHALALLVLGCGMGSTGAFGAYEPESRHVSAFVHAAGNPVGPDDVHSAGAPPATCQGPMQPGPRRTNETLQRSGIAEQVRYGPARTNDTGEELYRKACATCHGADGRGAPAALLGFDIPLPDFTDCNFATREPDADWLAVAHQGGPVRGFAREMPAFGDALTQDELQKILDHIRTLCPDDEWPRGELNTPRPLVTEKAFPEDEAVLTTTVDIVASRGAILHELLYEKRFGARNQFEVVVPFGFEEHRQGGQLGDVALGLKRVMLQSLSHGSILSLGGEVILPTGRKNRGIGKGLTRIEPFASYGQILPADAFLQFQGGFELPLDRNAAADEAFFRGVAGKSFTQGNWGRTWSPMLEVLGTRPLGAEGVLHWDIVPQAQITLNRRQHVMLNIGLRIPADQYARDAQFIVYLLWEWFDGGFFEGW